jgi:hypothetical protein
VHGIALKFWWRKAWCIRKSIFVRYLPDSHSLASGVHLAWVPEGSRHDTECHLKIEFGTAEHGDLQSCESPSIVQPAPEKPQAKKHTLLPVLVVLFLVSYGLMTMLIVEQGRTIDSQRALIRELFRDSSELFGIKRAQALEGRQSQGQVQNPSTQNPSSQVPSKQAPSSQAGAQANPQAIKPNVQVPAPSRPAADLSDIRRALIKI